MVILSSFVSFIIIRRQREIEIMGERGILELLN